MNELDEIYLRSVSNETLGGDLTALNAVKWDRTEDQPDGTRVGFDDMTGQSFVLGKSELPPAAPAPAAEAPPPVQEGTSLGEFLGKLNVALDAPFSGVAEGIARFVGNTIGATGIVEQKEVDRFFKMVDDVRGMATKDNPTADVLGTVGRISGQYIVPAVTGYNALRSLKAPKLLSSIVAEGMTGLLGLSPNDENIFNMLAEDSSSPAVAKVREMLATDPDDPEWTNRARNAADALLLLGASEALMRGLPKLVEQGKQFIKSDKGQQVVRSVEEMGARADERLGSVMRGETLSVNPIGAAGDMALSAAGKVAGRAGGEQVATDLDPQGFFSAVSRAVDTIPMDKGSGAQMRAMIAKGEGVKAEEMAWTGLDDFLAGKKSVTKQEVRDYVDANQVRVEEVVKAGDYPQRTADEWQSLITQAESRQDFDEAERLTREWEAAEGFGGAGSPKFGEYTLPGGENYREVVLTLPETRGSTISNAELARLDELTDKRIADSLDGLTDAERDEYISLVGKREDKGQFRGPHYDEPNVLAHIRLNDRTGPNGEKILFVEEIQSDWHQMGRKKGYGDAGVPDAPLKKTWHEMSWRRVARIAAEEGYDAIAWTPGKVQIERYDLRKYLSEIHLSGTNLKAYDLDGKTVIERTGVKSEDLPDIIGKEAADRLMSQKPKGSLRSLTGQELEVGGEGMEGFYDQMLKKYAEKWGKKFGSKVGVTKIARDYPEMADDQKLLDDLGVEATGSPHHEVWSMPVTPKMRDSVLKKGVPLFSAAGATAATGAAMQNDNQPASERVF